MSIEFGSPEAARIIHIERNYEQWQSLKVQLEEARREVEYWREEARRLEEKIRKLEKGESE